MQLPVFKFKNDSYTKRRGKPSILLISCNNCKQYLMSYQKDGPGPLLRCYVDRIHHPENLEKLQYLSYDEKTAKNLECNSCSIVIGSPMIYEKENRPAYLMRPGFFIKQRYKKTKKIV